MRRLWWPLGIVLALALALAGAGFTVSELGGEVVILRPRDGSRTATTRLWIVDDEGRPWLRAGSPGSGWLRRIAADPDVEMERAGRPLAVRAAPVSDPDVRDRINRLMREKYGFADRVVSFLVVLTAGDRARSVPVRLDPAPPAR